MRKLEAKLAIRVARRSGRRSRIIGVSAEVAALIASKILGSGVNMQSTFFLRQLTRRVGGVGGGLGQGSAEGENLGSVLESVYEAR